MNNISVELLKAYAPVIVQLIVTVGTIITVIINNRKKTQESIDSFKEELTKASKETSDKVDALDKKLSGHIKENEDKSALVYLIFMTRYAKRRNTQKATSMISLMTLMSMRHMSENILTSKTTEEKLRWRISRRSIISKKKPAGS